MVPPAGTRVADSPAVRVADLYALPPSEFVRARNALAKSLSGEKRKEVMALRRPSAAVWRANSLAREQPDRIGQLIDLGPRLLRAQRALMSTGDRETLRATISELNGLVTSLLEDVPERERAAVEKLLRAAPLAGAEDTKALRRGVLAQALQGPVGFEAVPAVRLQKKVAKVERPRVQSRREERLKRAAEREAQRRQTADARRRERLAAEANRLDRIAAALEAKARQAREKARAAKGLVDAA
jgi:hypothetical protein